MVFVSFYSRRFGPQATTDKNKGQTTKTPVTNYANSDIGLNYPTPNNRRFFNFTPTLPPHRQLESHFLKFSTRPPSLPHRQHRSAVLSFALLQHLSGAVGEEQTCCWRRANMMLAKANTKQKKREE